MSFEAVISHYGLAAVALGAGLEGETTVMTGGVLARQDLLSLPSVIAAVAVGSFLADQAYFLVGRHFRRRAYVRRMLTRPAARRAISFLEHHPNCFILAGRFLYGLRTLSPIVVGASEVSQARFMVLNAIAATVWGAIFATLGYEVGDRLAGLMKRAHPFTHLLLVGFLLAIGVVVAVRLVRRHRRHRPRMPARAIDGGNGTG